MKKKALLSSILTIALCFSLIGGSTYALFTNESEVNMAAASATVSIEAKITGLMLKDLNEAQYVRSVANGETANFESGTTPDTRTVTFTDGNKLTLSNIVPGDSIKFNVEVDNDSNVAIKYRVVISAEGELFSGLKVTADGETFLGKSYTAWTVLEAGVDGATVPFEITLPDSGNNEHDNKYQGKTCDMVVRVEAVQGNAGTFDDTSAGTMVDTEVNTATGKLETTVGSTVSANGFKAEIPAGTALEEGATTATLVVTKEEANTGNFSVAGADTVGLNISIPEVAEDNEAPIRITLTNIIEPGSDGTYPNGVMLYHKGEAMTLVGTADDVDEDGEFFYDSTNGSITLATNSFSNFTMLVAEKVATEAELTEAINAGKSVIFTKDIELTKTLIIRKNVIIDLNGYNLGGTVRSYENQLLQSSSDTDPHVVITSSKSGATINAGDKSVILGYGKTEIYNVEINVGTVTSSQYAPFKVYGDLTLGAGVAVNVDYLGTSLIANSAKADVVIDGAKINVDEFNVNAGYMISVNDATTVDIEDAEFNVKLTYNPTFPPYFVKPANATIENTSFNVTDTEATKAYTFNENYKWVEK